MEKLNKKQLRERISSAILSIALIVSISGVIGAVAMLVVGNRYDYALNNYGFSQGDIGKMMITFAESEVTCVRSSDMMIRIWWTVVMTHIARKSRRARNMWIQ